MSLGCNQLNESLLNKGLSLGYITGQKGTRSSECSGLSAEVSEMSRRACGLSSVELMLSTLLLLLLVVCVGLSVVTWLALDSSTGTELKPFTCETCWRGE